TPARGGCMQRRRLVIGGVLVAGVVTALLGHAVTAVSVGGNALVYRATVNANDLEGLEGLATPGSVVHLYMRQRNFKDGTPDGADRFDWCAWKNNGRAIFIATTWADQNGVFKFTGLRANATSIMLFPASAGDDVCRGGLFTELQLVECSPWSGTCTSPEVPTMHWLNARKLPGGVGAAMGRISNAYQASISVSDGPNDGPEFSDVIDVDQNGFDTTKDGGAWG